MNCEHSGVHSSLAETARVDERESVRTSGDSRVVAVVELVEQLLRVEVLRDGVQVRAQQAVVLVRSAEHVLHARDEQLHRLRLVWHVRDRLRARRRAARTERRASATAARAFSTGKDHN